MNTCEAEKNIFSIFLRNLIIASLVVTAILIFFSGGMQTLSNPFSTWVGLTLFTAIITTIFKNSFFRQNNNT